jgi:hypothetical protein
MGQQRVINLISIIKILCKNKTPLMSIKSILEVAKGVLLSGIYFAAEVKSCCKMHNTWTDYC